MVQDLLVAEIAIKGASGALLLLFPRSLARVLGLPAVGETFWPRLLGAVLAGLAVATLLEVQLTSKNGMGLAAHVAVNLTAVLALTGLMIAGRAGTTRRGRAIIVIAITGLIVLALFELAWV